MGLLRSAIGAATDSPASPDLARQRFAAFAGCDQRAPSPAPSSPRRSGSAPCRAEHALDDAGAEGGVLDALPGAKLALVGSAPAVASGRPRPALAALRDARRRVSPVRRCGRASPALSAHAVTRATPCIPPADPGADHRDDDVTTPSHFPQYAWMSLRRPLMILAARRPYGSPLAFGSLREAFSTAARILGGREHNAAPRNSKATRGEKRYSSRFAAGGTCPTNS
jgi:hypothetical protein